VEPAPVKDEKEEGDELIVFVVDKSGSMYVNA
jgi:Mg-chelatase subunit ChlD